MGTLDEILAKLDTMGSRLKTLETENARLRDRVTELESELEKAQREGKQQAAPFRKPRDQRKPPEEHKKPGRKPGHEPNFKKPPSPDQVDRTVEVPLGRECQCCGEDLEQREQHEHYVVDIPRMSAIWTRFLTESGYCAKCKKRRCSRSAEMPSVAVGP